MSKPCESCGIELRKEMLNRYANDRTPLFSKKLPELDNGPRSVNIPLERVKEFNNDYIEVSLFAAWACGVDIKNFCRSDIMRATGAWKEIARRIRAANED